jgi:hypothetical protein
MPNFMSIPRELRDEIFHWMLKDPAKASPGSRKKVSPSDPETVVEEQPVRYPQNTTPPTTHSILQTCRQLRAEVADAVRRLGPLRYSITLTDVADSRRIYPTWHSVPMLASHVDELDVYYKIRSGKTSSIVSYLGEDFDADDTRGEEYRSRVNEDPVMASLILLRRFLERGPQFLSRKKQRPITLGVLAIRFDYPPGMRPEEVDEQIEEVLDWFQKMTFGRLDDDDSLLDDRQEMYDDLVTFICGRVSRITITLGKVQRRDWDLKTLLKRRDRLRAEEAAEQAALAAQAAAQAEAEAEAPTRAEVDVTSAEAEATTQTEE